MEKRNIYPIITQEKQKFYENLFIKHPELKHYVPEICGYYGRACRQMGNKADRMLCTDCTLSRFVSIVEEIINCCDRKESMGLERLHDSDVYSISEALEEKNIHIGYCEIGQILEYLEEYGLM